MLTDMDLLHAIGALCIKYKNYRYIYNKEFRRKLGAFCAIYYTRPNENGITRRHRSWVRPIFCELRRRAQGDSHNLVNEIRLNDPDKYFNFMRMMPSTFEELLSIVGPSITKQDTVFRDSIHPSTRLQITLRYLATGDSMTSLSYCFRLGISTVSKIIHDTCNQIWLNLKDRVFLEPKQENWEKVASDFEMKWNFPNCVGAIDGKHVVIEAPSNSGSTYYNYKSCHSIILLAITDANNCFVMVDIGATGRQSDAGVFRNSILGQRFETNSFHLPQPRSLISNGPCLPYILVGDEAFALTTYLMRPYPRRGTLNRKKKVFNYRLSRARRLVESSFGLLAGRWRIYRQPIIASVLTVEKIIQATVCLHNFIMRKEAANSTVGPQYSTYPSKVANTGSLGLQQLNQSGSNNYTRSASAVRDHFADYFETVGAVEWQWEKVLRNDF